MSAARTKARALTSSALHIVASRGGERLGCSTRLRLGALAPAVAFAAGIVAIKPFWSHHAAWAGYEPVFLTYPAVLFFGVLVTGVLIIVHAAIQSRSQG